MTHALQDTAAAQSQRFNFSPMAEGVYRLDEPDPLVRGKQW